jgi:hypothetical protein
LCAAGAALVGTQSAHADPTLSWSYALADSGFNDVVGPPPKVVFPPVILQTQSNSGDNFNASASVTDPRWGSAAAWTDANDFVPALHGTAFGAKFGPSQIAFDLAIAQGLQVFTWTGGSFDFDPAWIQGTLDYHTAVGPFSYVNAGLALIDANVLASHPGLGDSYFAYGIGAGGAGNVFSAGCGTDGGLGFANTGPSEALGSVSVTADMTSCGLVHLQTGDKFGFWSKLVVYTAGNGLTWAGDTFSINFAPGVDPTIQGEIVSNIVPTSFDPGVTPVGFLPSAAPEPGAWATLLLGLCGLGGAMRERRRRRSVPA